MKDPVVFIGVPSGSEWKAEFGMSLAGLIAHSAHPLRNGARIAGLRLWNSRGSILPKLRTMLVQKAMEAGASHILFVDSDMSFPPDTLHRLLAWDKPVIACNCATKMLPSTPTARLHGETRAGEPMYSLPDDIGIRRVWRVGTGVMLIRTKIFERMPQPWFDMPWDDVLQDYRGEDWSMCDKLDALGVPIYVDLGLSKTIGHHGDLKYTHEHVAIPQANFPG